MRGLPPTSATVRAVHGPAAAWGPAEELAALQAEIAHRALAWQVRVHAKKGTKAMPPLHVPRPYEHVEPRRVTREDFRRTLLGG